MASSSSNTCQQTQSQQSQQSSTMDFGFLAKTLHFNLPIKLDEDNYIYWKTQILPAVNALDLEEYIDSSKHPPSHAAAPNQAYIGQSSHNSDQQNTVSQGFHQEAFQPQGNYTQTSAYVAAPAGGTNDSSWFVDSGATNHITSDLNNLSIKSEYKGSSYSAPTSTVPIHTIVDMVTSNNLQPNGSSSSQIAFTALPSVSASCPETSPTAVSTCLPAVPSIVVPTHPMVTRSKNGIFKPKAYTSTCFLWLLLNFIGWLANGKNITLTEVRFVNHKRE
ncbi:hypothetical protein ACOSQ2_005072 [Xanthoceras sorbifolium]